MTIKEIILILDNREKIILERDNVGWMQISDIKTDILKFEPDTVHMLNQANKIVIEILKDFKYDSFGKEKSVFERLTSFHDIVAVVIVNKDETSKTYHADYEESEDGLNNINQRELIFGDKLTIAIGKNIDNKNCKKI